MSNHAKHTYIKAYVNTDVGHYKRKVLFIYPFIQLCSYVCVCFMSLKTTANMEGKTLRPWPSAKKVKGKDVMMETVYGNQF